MNTSLALILIAALWMGWIIYWLISALDTKATRWREPLTSQALHRVPIWVAVWLFLEPRFLPRILTQRFLPPSTIMAVLSIALLVAGLALSIWARRHLGRNWSGSVALKENHTLIVDGPYSVVRHPIYSGILLGILGTALAMSEWRGLLAFFAVLAAFVVKSRVEEKTMRETFSEYDGYQSRTAALLPFAF